MQQKTDMCSGTSSTSAREGWKVTVRGWRRRGKVEALAAAAGRLGALLGMGPAASRDRKLQEAVLPDGERYFGLETSATPGCWWVAGLLWAHDPRPYLVRNDSTTFQTSQICITVITA